MRTTRGPVAKTAQPLATRTQPGSANVPESTAGSSARECTPSLRYP
jgi:hypothetical protein